MGFRLAARQVATPSGADPTKKYYWLQMQIQPLIGLWNPHNITLAPMDFVLEWAVYPYLRLGLENGTATERPEVWMRDLWQTRGNDGLHGRWFRLRTDSIDSEPGEFRYSSIDEKSRMANSDLDAPTSSRDGAHAARSYFNSSGSLPPARPGSR